MDLPGRLTVMILEFLNLSIDSNKLSWKLNLISFKRLVSVQNSNWNE